MKNHRRAHREQVILSTALLLAIPAFYLILSESAAQFRLVGHILYALGALLLAAKLMLLPPQAHSGRFDVNQLDRLLLVGMIASAWPTAIPWSTNEWWLRIGFSLLVFARLSTSMVKVITPNRLLTIMVMAVLLLALGGAGFWWLEPGVTSYADGVWLAFITGATVGYGDLVPSTPGARIFAGFTVLLGYALFSVLTASISAFLVGEDEQRLRQEMHADMRLLRAEIALLREELHRPAAGD